MSEQGERLNIRKATLRDWRHEFARHLRNHGIAANATDRVVRGVTTPRKRDGIYRAENDERSTHMWKRRESVVAELSSGSVRGDPGRAGVLLRRKSVEQGWRRVSHALHIDGKHELATDVDRILEGMPPARTEREWIKTTMLEVTRQRRTRERVSICFDRYALVVREID
jgi:hypothetical protein